MSSTSRTHQAIRDHAQRAVDDGVWPAAQFAVARNGELLAFESFGRARDSDRFCMFSATKPIVASVVWQLLGEGLITLETRVAKVWPEFGAHGKDVITLEQVLLHTCGFPNATLDATTATTRDERAALMADWRLEWQPGTRYAYHGYSAHWVLAELIQRLTGQDHRQAVRTRVLDPLGLKRLELGVPKERQGDLKRVSATGKHAVDVLEALLGRPVDEQALDASESAVLTVANDPELIALGVPGANAFSNAADVAIFYQELLWNSSQVWQPDVLQDATRRIRNTLPDEILMGAPANRTIGLTVTGPGDGVALEIPSLGISASLRPFGPHVSEHAFGHGGAGGQAAWADPESGLSFCLLTNGMDRDAVADRRRHDAIEGLAAQWA
ncbi:serine hydrolase domain-containing protein [Streptomyces sp. NPDC102462]|uniref:serine hydrolase domain-containing protein n=1 Tax=Streptomyces sp. NPDC102462 TaxID=3366178 RepID=UPI003822519F